MARQLTDGAESGDTSRLVNINNGGGNWSAGGTPRTGSYAYAKSHNNGTGSVELPLLNAASEIYLRVGVRNSANLAMYLVKFLNGSSEAGSIRITGFSTSVNITGYDGTTLRVTSLSVNWAINAYHVLEVHYKQAAAPNGIIEIKFDGTPVASFTGATNSQSQITALQLIISGSTVHTPLWDDFAVNDTTGGVDNSWIGDGGVLAALVPDAAGNYTDLLASAGTPYQAVDEIPANGDTDYVYESTVDKKSTYGMSAMSALPAGASISRVWLELYARKTVAEDDKIATLLRSGSTDDQGVDQSLSTAYQRFLSEEYLTDPADSAAWTSTKVDALEAGAVVR